MKDQIAKTIIPLGGIMCFFPQVSSAVALAVGVALALFVGNPYLDRTRKWTKPLLAWSIVGLGAGVNLLVVLKAGMNGFLFTAVSIVLTLTLGHFIGRLFKTDFETSTLINVGTAICGGSAIAAVSSAIRARDESISVSLAIVFILNAVALFIFPSIGYFFQLSENQFGTWAALAIHDTSSVVGASMQYGAHALEVGTTIKLVRALWIVPISILAAQFLIQKKEGQVQVKPSYPWFIGGFLIISALVTSFPILQNSAHIVEWVARRGLVITLFLIGSGLTMQTLKKVGINAFLHGVVLWLAVGALSLTAILFGL